MNDRLLEKLACPVCRGKLKYCNEHLECLNCPQTYNLIRSVPDFLPVRLLEKYTADRKRQELHEEQRFYENLFSTLDGLDDGHCVVYGYDEIYKFMSNVRTGTVLDVGCGAGHHSKDLAMLGYEVTGIDISVNGLMQAQRIAKANKACIDFVLGDSENLPFADRAFDVVFCSLILHHFPTKDRVLQEIARVCKSHVIAFEVNSYDPISFVRFNILNPTVGIDNITKNQRTVSPAKLKKSLQQLGFDDFQLKYVDVHHYIGREPHSFRGTVLRAYQALLRPFPAMFRSNKFLLQCKRPCF